MRKTHNLYLKSLLGASLLILSVQVSCLNETGNDDSEQIQTKLPSDSLYVKAIALQDSSFSHELVSNGIITAEERADLYFESAEVIEEIYVKNGQKVHKGQKIAMLSQFKLINALNQAYDNLEKSKLELQNVLISQGYLLRDSLKIPSDIMKIARTKSNYYNSTSLCDLAQLNLKRSVLYAPFDGIIANLNSKKFNLPSVSKPFCTIIGSRCTNVQFKILESEFPLIQIGTPVSVYPFAISEYHTEGTVQEINPIVDENGMVEIVARIARQSPKLLDGMNVRVIARKHMGKRLLIPKSAVVLRNNKSVVFTARNGKAIWNYVQVGIENSSGYVINEGLKQGDSVIYDGNLNLAHEAPIQVVK